MEKETKCMIGEQIGEVIIGGSMGIITKNMILPHCDTVCEKIIVSLGAGLGGFVIGRKWAKQWFKFCDATFDTDFEDVCETL